MPGGAQQGLATAFAMAPFVDMGWDSALHGLAAATRSSHAQLLSLTERHLRFNWLTDTPDDYVEQFVSIEAHRPDVNWRVAASGAPFEIIHESHYDAVRARGENDAYRDHIERYGGVHGCQTALLDEPGAFFGLAALRTASDGRSSEADRAQFAAAAPHVLAAIRVQYAVEHQGMALMRGTLDAIGTPAFLMDATGAVGAGTAAAEACLSSGALSIRGGRLFARDRRDDAQLQQRIGAALRGVTATQWTDLWIDDGAGARMLVEALALPRLPWSFGFAPAAIVTLRRPVRASLADAAGVMAAFGLTRAEAEIATMLAGGVSRASIAATRGTSPQTLASQMKTIFRKCDVRREAELVAGVLSVLQARTPR